MPSESKVYIAGVGYSPSPSGSSLTKNAIASLVSAATKALLDAGVTYDFVTRGVRSKTLNSGSEVFNLFDHEAITVDQVDGGSELNKSFDLVAKQGEQCALMIVAEKSATIALVVVSENFIWRNPYLKDSSALIQKSSSSKSSSGSLQDICKIVWTLRGWSSDHSNVKSSHGFELSRSDNKEIPKWEEVEHRQDGKHRLRYNPAREMREASHEDFEAVKAASKIQFNRRGGDRAALAKL